MGAEVEGWIESEKVRESEDLDLVKHSSEDQENCEGSNRN